jgi:hypothetical protein
LHHRRSTDSLIGTNRDQRVQASRKTLTSRKKPLGDVRQCVRR